MIPYPRGSGIFHAVSLSFLDLRKWFLRTIGQVVNGNVIMIRIATGGFGNCPFIGVMDVYARSRKVFRFR
jgi:hypothetical protein